MLFPQNLNNGQSGPGFPGKSAHQFCHLDPQNFPWSLSFHTPVLQLFCELCDLSSIPFMLQVTRGVSIAKSWKSKLMHHQTGAHMPQGAVTGKPGTQGLTSMSFSSLSWTIRRSDLHLSVVRMNEMCTKLLAHCLSQTESSTSIRSSSFSSRLIT